MKKKSIWLDIWLSCVCYCTLSAVKIGFLYWILWSRHFCSFQNGTTAKPIWTTIWMQIRKYNLLLQFMLCFCWPVPEQCPALLIHHPVNVRVTGLQHLFLPVIPGIQEMTFKRNHMACFSLNYPKLFLYNGNF